MSNIPSSISQNPAPNPTTDGQDYISTKQELVDEIMGTFREILPSNYVALANGPFYTLQFQAMVEQLAEIQIMYTEVYKDSLWDFTRSDFLWQVLGTLVFPNNNVPKIDGDTELRTFLTDMVLALLKGSTVQSMQQGLQALQDGLVVTIVERYLQTPPRDPNGGYTIDDQFIIDVLLENGFESDPFVLQENVRIVMSALKPAHVFYSFSYLFQDAFGSVPKEDAFVLDLEDYHYADMRKNWFGAKSITGVGDIISSNMFSDPSVSFENITPNLKITLQGKQYPIKQVLHLKGGVDTTPRSYTLSTGDTGTVVAVSDSTLYDSSFDWGTVPRDTTITITDGKNSGTYRLDRVTGNQGGFIGDTSVGGNYVRVSPSILKLEGVLQETPNQSYSVEVDRLGVLEPNVVTDENVTNQFIY